MTQSRNISWAAVAVNKLRPCACCRKLKQNFTPCFPCFSQNSTLDGTPSIAAFMNFNTPFKQQYPHLLHSQHSQSPISNDPLTSLSTQNDFLSLPTVGQLKSDKIPSTDQEKLNNVISQTRRWVESKVARNSSIERNQCVRVSENAFEAITQQIGKLSLYVFARPLASSFSRRAPGSLNHRIKQSEAHAIMCSWAWNKMPFHCVFASHFALSPTFFLLLFCCFSFNDLLIDDTPNIAMSASNNSQRPNESSAEDELDEDDDEEIDEKKQNGANGTDLNNKTLLVSLLKQINMLHETNSKIFRNLHETKGKWVMCKISIWATEKLFWHQSLDWQLNLFGFSISLAQIQFNRFPCSRSWNGGFEVCTELGAAPP